MLLPKHFRINDRKIIMFRYDFIIQYEHRQRELENAVLLALMLEKKGYKVAIENRYSARILFQRADVIITPYLYLTETVVYFALQPFCHFKKIINMQYEQVFKRLEEKKLGSLPNGVAKNAVHISWGRNTTERYKKVGINPDHIFEIGHISMDLNTTKYKGAFLNRRDISSRFNIPMEKKWLLFISSFSCIGLTKTVYENWKKRTVGTDYFSDISYKSQPIILDYLEELAKNHPELIVIYRPHPFEAGCIRLTELKNKYDNFKVFSYYSIRQWILITDYISTWSSTSLVDVFFANKPCAIIRPIPFQKEYDFPIYRDQNIISNYADLEKFISNPNEHYKINPKPIREYYSNSSNADTFEKLRDLCIQVKNDKKYEYNYYEAIRPSYINLLKFYVYKILMSFAKFIDFSKISLEKYRSDVQYAHREMTRCQKEIEFYRKRFSEIMKNEST